MKRLVLVFTCLLLLSSCSAPQQSDEAEDVNVNPFFNAEIVRWDTDEVVLYPVDIPNEEIDDQFVLLGEFSIPASTFEKHGIAILESGDMVRVVCSGIPEDSDSKPASLDTVFSIYLLDADGNILIE